MSELRGKIYTGIVMARRWCSTEGFTEIGNIDELTISQEVETKELISTGRDDYGQAKESLIIPKPPQIKIGQNTFDREAMARALMGESINLDTSIKTITDEKHPYVHGLIDLAHIGIDEQTVVVKKGTTVIDADKVEVIPNIGMIEVNDSSLNVGDEIKVSYKTAGRSGYAIDANTMQSYELEIRIDGKDLVTQKDGILEIPHAVMSSNGNINFFDTDWWKAGMTGTLVKDKGKPTSRFIEFDN